MPSRRQSLQSGPVYLAKVVLNPSYAVLRAEAIPGVVSADGRRCGEQV